MNVDEATRASAQARGDEWAADPVGVAKRELAAIEAALAVAADAHEIDGLKYARIVAESRVREARAIVDAPRLLAAEIEHYAQSWLWAHDMLTATSELEQDRLAKAWGERYPITARYLPRLAAHELATCTEWLATNAPARLAELQAGAVRVSSSTP